VSPRGGGGTELERYKGGSSAPRARVVEPNSRLTVGETPNSRRGLSEALRVPHPPNGGRGMAYISMALALALALALAHPFYSKGGGLRPETLPPSGLSLLKI
jgi:hypothetical protein